MERSAECALARPYAIEEWGSPTHLEGPSSAKDHAQVDIFGCLDYLLLKHAVNFIGKAVFDA